MKHRRNLWWTKLKEQFANFLVSERKEEDMEKKGRERNKSPRTKQFLGRSGRWLFLLLILMQNWFCVDAAVGRLEPKVEAEVPEIIIVLDAVKGTFVNLDWKRSKGVDRNEMRKEERIMRWCALLNDSAWSTEREHMRRYKGTFDIFFGIEHRLVKEEMEGEQVNREAKKGWKFAADTARSPMKGQAVRIESTHQEEFFVAIDSNWGVVVGAEEGAD